MNARNKKNVEDLSLNGKRVLVRCDFNVPVKDGAITNDKRIQESLKTIRYLVDQGARVILCSHLGRPKNGYAEEFSMKPVAARLSELLGQPVKMAKDVVGEDAKALAASLQDGEVMLLENVRFHKEETKNDPEFSISWPLWQSCMSTTLSALHTGPTPQPPGWRTTCPPPAAT